MPHRTYYLAVVFFVVVVVVVVVAVVVVAAAAVVVVVVAVVVVVVVVVDDDVVIVVVVFSFILVWHMAKLGGYSPTLINAMVSVYASCHVSIGMHFELCRKQLKKLGATTQSHHAPGNSN